MWKVVSGEDNRVLGEADMDDIMQYIYTYARHVEHAEGKVAGV